MGHDITEALLEILRTIFCQNAKGFTRVECRIIEDPRGESCYPSPSNIVWVELLLESKEWNIIRIQRAIDCKRLIDGIYPDKLFNVALDLQHPVEDANEGREM